MNLKKILVLMIAVIATIKVSAQNEGEFMIGGNLSYSTNSTSSEQIDVRKVTILQSKYFAIMPSLHYFVRDNIAVGLGLGIDYEKTHYYPSDIPSELANEDFYNKRTLFVIEPSAYYYVKILDNFYYTPEFYIGYATGKPKSDYVGRNDNGEYIKLTSSGDEKLTTLNAGLNLTQFEYRPTDYLSLGIGITTGNITFSRTKSKTETSSYEYINTQSSFNFGINQNILTTLSVRYCF